MFLQTMFCIMSVIWGAAILILIGEIIKTENMTLELRCHYIRVLVCVILIPVLLYFQALPMYELFVGKLYRLCRSCYRIYRKIKNFLDRVEWNRAPVQRETLSLIIWLLRIAYLGILISVIRTEYATLELVYHYILALVYSIMLFIVPVLVYSIKLFIVLLLAVSMCFLIFKLCRSCCRYICRKILDRVQWYRLQWRWAHVRRETMFFIMEQLVWIVVLGITIADIRAENVTLELSNNSDINSNARFDDESVILQLLPTAIITLNIRAENVTLELSSNTDINSNTRFDDERFFIIVKAGLPLVGYSLISLTIFVLFSVLYTNYLDYLDRVRNPPVQDPVMQHLNGDAIQPLDPPHIE